VVRPRRRPSARPPPLGQHFLFDRSILERIVQALDPEPSDVVLEIGAGPGTLTRVLAERVGHVIAIEKDARLAEKLREEGRGKGEGVRVVTADALRIDWHGLLHDTLPPSHFPLPFKVVGNIPYAITSPLIDKALSAPLPERIVFLVQAEVATRLAAAPGSKQYGALSVGVQALCHVESLFGVAPGAFRPPPRVRSAVVRLRPLHHPLIVPGEGDGFRAFVQACFSLRRKQLINVLRAVTEGPAEVVQGWLAALGIDVKQRPETLHPHQFVALFRRVGATTLRRSDRL
jgi:16S rRNA (adenine1518-N6/adenine1519-N6)-dimethyltransferase